MKIRINKFFGSLSHTKLAFFITGIAATCWFLIRVIPKPSRAAYPCMRASAPFMSAFVLYLIGLTSTLYLFKEKKGRLLLLKSALGIVFVISLLFSFRTSTSLVETTYFQPNQPIGVAKGIFPGRVVWIYNPAATNANMANTVNDNWSMDINCNQNQVEAMLFSGIRRIGGKANVKESWDEIFKYFNNTHGKGMVGYTPGEKIAIKINLTNSAIGTPGPNRMDASPQLVLAILKQLVKVVGVAQSDIWIGDNYRTFRENYYQKCRVYFPNVHYVDGTGLDGREKTVPSSEQLLKFSDKKETSSIPQHMVNASYIINIPCLKSHDSAGITLAAKNHQGTVLEKGTAPENQSAMYMHYALPVNNPKMGSYRHLVDYMGHKDLGGKTLLYLVDGLWAGRSWEGFLEKWQMAPFNNDYPSSLFLSQDAVAIESVCYDFLLAEYANKSSNQKYPYMSGVDDYMIQAADPTKWAAGITYDPEGDGTPISSLGVYEHWNNATDKQYSRNLKQGNGIELTSYFSQTTDPYKDELTTGISQNEGLGYRVFPNPFSERIVVEAKDIQPLKMFVYDLKGQLVFNTVVNKSYTWAGNTNGGSEITKGTYLVKLAELKSGKTVLSEKIIYQPK
ncbi:MAG: DUF362 domain-containing protein [Candidatus Saccharibacteria bacterium]